MNIYGNDLPHEGVAKRNEAYHNFRDEAQSLLEEGSQMPRTEALRKARLSGILLLLPAIVFFLPKSPEQKPTALSIDTAASVMRSPCHLSFGPWRFFMHVEAHTVRGLASPISKLPATKR